MYDIGDMIMNYDNIIVAAGFRYDIIVFTSIAHFNILY